MTGIRTGGLPDINILFTTMNKILQLYFNFRLITHVYQKKLKNSDLKWPGQSHSEENKSDLTQTVLTLIYLEQRAWRVSVHLLNIGLAGLSDPATMVILVWSKWMPSSSKQWAAVKTYFSLRIDPEQWSSSDNRMAIAQGSWNKNIKRLSKCETIDIYRLG